MSVPGSRHASTIAVMGRERRAPPVRSRLWSPRSAPGASEPRARQCRRISAVPDSPGQARRSPARSGRHGASGILPPQHLQRTAPSLRSRKAGRSERVHGAFPAFRGPAPRRATATRPFHRLPGRDDGESRCLPARAVPAAILTHKSIRNNNLWHRWRCIGPVPGIQWGLPTAGSANTLYGARVLDRCLSQGGGHRGPGHHEMLPGIKTTSV